MEKKEFLTITEFASMAGVSRQTIYNNLDTKLSNYVKVDEAGKKVVNSRALSLFGVKDLTDFDAVLTSKFDTKCKDDLTELDTNFTPVLDILRAQLETKDKQIERLQDEISRARQEIEEKDKHIREQANQILEILDHSQELQRNSQVLLALTQKLKQLEDGKKRKGFWGRLFSKEKEE